MVNWNAVSAIATIGYLGASVALWWTAARAAKAAERQADLTAKAVETAAGQAEVARQQFELSRQMFFTSMRPLLAFLWADVSEPGGKPRCEFRLVNLGKSIATDVRWRIQFLTGSSPHIAIAPEPGIEILPREEYPHSPGDPILKIPDAAADGVHIEVQYSNPFDPDDVRHSICLIEQTASRRRKKTFTDIPVNQTRTNYDSGRQWP